MFILAGQSNMVGHANDITLPRLFVDERPEVQKLASLVFKEGHKVTEEMVDQQIATRIARDKLNNDLRRKVIQGEKAIAEAQAQLKQLQAKYDAGGRIDFFQVELARQAGLEGMVVVNVIIDETGKPESARVVRSVAEVLDKAAVEAVMKQRFEPGRQRNRPVRVEMAIPVRFQLTDAQ